MIWFSNWHTDYLILWDFRLKVEIPRTSKQSDGELVYSLKQKSYLGNFRFREFIHPHRNKPVIILLPTEISLVSINISIGQSWRKKYSSPTCMIGPYIPYRTMSREYTTITRTIRAGWIRNKRHTVLKRHLFLYQFMYLTRNVILV